MVPTHSEWYARALNIARNVIRHKLSSYTRAMGCSPHLVCYDLSVPEWGGTIPRVKKKSKGTDNRCEKH